MRIDITQRRPSRSCLSFRRGGGSIVGMDKRRGLRAAPGLWWVLALLCVGGGRAGAADASELLRAELGKLTGANFRIHQAGMVVAVTDAPDALAGTCVKHLSAALPRMRGLARFPADAPAPDVLRVALLSRKPDFDRFLQLRRAPAAESFTCVDPDDPDRRAIAAFVLDMRPLLARLRNAAFDVLLRSWIPEPPAWLAAGLAECMEDAAFEADGQLRLGPPRGHLRDLRERVLQPRPSPLRPLKVLAGLEAADWEKLGSPGWLQSWALARFLLEDEEARKARLLQKFLAALLPAADEAGNAGRLVKVLADDDWTELEQAWRSYVDKLPETPAEQPYRKGRALLAQGQVSAARGLFDEAVKLDPDYERLYYFRAYAAAIQQDPASARADLDRALELFPEYHAARFLRGRCRRAAGDAEGARADFTACLPTPYAQQAKWELESLGK